MFSGIVEHCSYIQSARQRSDDVVEIEIERPSQFQDLSVGDSVAVNGVCLTVESFDSQVISFAVGPETLRVVGWTAHSLKGLPVNLERSLAAHSRVHGHWVSGHVDGVGRVLALRANAETLHLRIAFPKDFDLWIWPKGSVCVQGVSLTINSVGEDWFAVCLIPETLKRTNLRLLEIGSIVNLEADPMARGLAHIARKLLGGEAKMNSAHHGLAQEEI